MNKYIVPTIISFFLVIYLTYLVSFMVISKDCQKQINEYEGMKKTYIEEVEKRDDVIVQMEQEVKELKFNLESCESWCNSD